MTGADVWLDFEQVRHAVKNNTVDKLKQILSGFNEECATHVSKTGKKQDVIDRIVATLDQWRAQNMADKWTKAKAVINQVRITGSYTSSRANLNPTVLAAPTTSINHGHYSMPVMKPSYSNVTGSSSGIRYDPYAPPRKPPVPSNPVASSSAPKPLGIRFKESPFFQIDQAVSGITECSESTSATDRKQQSLQFTLTNEQLIKLRSSESRYQLRLFCTSSVFYAGQNSFKANPIPCPIEFPPTCEVRVNNVQLSANLKGLKKKPGTAPPPDIRQYVRLSGVQNRVEMVYVNSQQPPQLKKYYLIVMLVESVTVESLVSNLMAKNRKSSEEIRQSMVASLSDDDDIVAGPQKLSLKCPLSFLRIATPCRSSKCVHSQCFDATSWFSVMEQTTTWLCPICERALDPKDLVIDGYFAEILNACSDDVEDVMAEANGDWHTTDDKYASASWRASHPTCHPSKAPPVTHTSARFPPPPSAAELNGKTQTSDSQVFVLDSDDEDEGQVKRELSPSFASGSSVNGSTKPQSQTTQGEAVIDLTLDSDEDESPPQQSGKRKATESDIVSSSSPTEQIWKKSRVDSGTFRGSLTSTTTSLHTPTSPHRHATGYLTQPTPPVTAIYPYTATTASSTGSHRLPGISSILPSASGRWP